MFAYSIQLSPGQSSVVGTLKMAVELADREIARQRDPDPELVSASPIRGRLAIELEGGNACNSRTNIDPAIHVVQQRSVLPSVRVLDRRRYRVSNG